jgi:hypothetical protein
MAFLRKRPKPARLAAEKAEAAETAATPGALAPSPNPATNLLLADIALRGGSALLKRAVEAGLVGTVGKGPRQNKSTGTGKGTVKGSSLGRNLVGTMLVRVATRSVPGALIVGGGLLAKTLYDRKRSRAAARQDADKLAERGRKGRR